MKFFLIFFFVSNVYQQTVYKLNFNFNISSSLTDMWRSDKNALVSYENISSFLYFNFSSIQTKNFQIPKIQYSDLNNLKISSESSIFCFITQNSFIFYNFNYEIVENDFLNITLKEKILEIYDKNYFIIKKMKFNLGIELKEEEITLQKMSKTLIINKFNKFYSDINGTSELFNALSSQNIMILMNLPINYEEFRNFKIKLINSQFNISFKENNYNFITEKDRFIISNEYYKLPFYFSLNSQKYKPYFVTTWQNTIKLLYFILNYENSLYLFEVDFQKITINFKGKIDIMPKYSILKLIDSELTDEITLIIKIQETNNLFLTLKKSLIFTQNEIYSCSICRYLENVECSNYDKSECNILLNLDVNSGDSHFTLWVSVSCSIVGFIFIFVIVCYIVQKYCIKARQVGNIYEHGYDEVANRIKHLNQKALETLVMERSAAPLSEIHKELNCVICLEKLNKYDVIYFDCKLHLVHAKCFMLYKEEGHTNEYKCPYRCNK